jgi:putative addiction module component (TIGR02574 family)
MVQDYKLLLRQALNLPSAEKVHLLSNLFENLMSLQQREREQLWAAEAERRVNEYDEGKVESEDWKSLRKRLEN